MKLPQLLIGTALLSGLLGTPAAVTTAQAAERGRALLDFTDVRRDRDPAGNESVIHCYEYTWGDWDKHVIDLRRKGALVKSTGTGQLGEQKTSLNFGKSPAAELDYVVGPGNQCKNLVFRLTDEDGTEAEWTIPLEGKTQNILVTARFDLAKPEHVTKPGKNGNLDAKRIVGWEIHGDWSKVPAEVMLVKLFPAP